MILYHDSLPALLAILSNEGVSIDDDLVVVRDASARLTACRVKFRDRLGLEKSVTAQLGNYAANPPIVDGVLAQRLIQDPNAKRVVSRVGESDKEFLYIDRRLVGADWLLKPQIHDRHDSVRIVFASLKGGVGRTTALSVAAASFAKQGLRVLAIDLDLEAPGIGSMLLPSSEDPRLDRRPKFGAIDYLIEEGINSIDDSLLVDFLGKSSFAEGFIDVLPAVGRMTDNNPSEFIPKLSRALTDAVSDGQVTPLWEKVSRMIQRFEGVRSYDVVLIDARAGISEVTAAPLLALGAQVLFFATDQDQTYNGYRYILSHISAQMDYSATDDTTDWRNTITFVQSKAPSTERARQRFREKIYDLCSEWLYESSDESDAFAFSSFEVGVGVPHDATYVRYDPAYDAFEPTINGDQLDPEVYSGPFAPFLSRLNKLVRNSGDLNG